MARCRNTQRLSMERCVALRSSCSSLPLRALREIGTRSGGRSINNECSAGSMKLYPTKGMTIMLIDKLYGRTGGFMRGCALALLACIGCAGLGTAEASKPEAYYIILQTNFYARPAGGFWMMLDSLRV